jgi:hypothetical protein
MTVGSLFCCETPGAAVTRLVLVGVGVAGGAVVGGVEAGVLGAFAAARTLGRWPA